MTMYQIFLQFVYVLVFDGVFVGVLALALMPLALTKHAASAVLKRNFIGYFSNPTGYVFLCVFVLLTSIAAFWPHEFFAANLANLDQLTTRLPLIMLVFIPAITMSIWAEERRQGTDELLLTIPVDDFDIVLGKYLAAAAIFTASLLFSQLSSFSVLNALALGDIDTGLFISTYLGYWTMGLAMLAIGMVASFLTSNLTVGFVLGALFNVPLVALMWSDAMIPSRDLAQIVSQWGVAAQLADFGRGVVSLSSVAYFTMVAVVGVYLSMVLIGRRHWLGGRDGHSMLGHYFIRTAALVAIALGANVVLSNHDLIRYDATSGKVSSLSPDTKKLIKTLDPEHMISIEAFVSRSVPEVYVQTRFELISMLSELDAKAGERVEVRIHDNLEGFSKEAVRAEEEFDIKPVTVYTKERGERKEMELILGAVFTCGLQKVVVPFFSRGVPVEYELIRSVCTVAEEEQRQIGVLRTDAELFGGLDFVRMQPRQRQLIIGELEKQYEVVDVDPNNPIEKDTYDVLLVVQPSSLTPPQLDNLLQAIRDGQPTALFEDPFPWMLTSAPGTSQPKRPPGGMMGMRRPPEPKGDIQKLWDLLGIKMVVEDEFPTDVSIIWQQYNPYPKVSSVAMITDQWVFIGPNVPGAEEENPPLSPANPISSNLQQLLFLFPGAVESAKDRPEGLSFTSLVRTGNKTGTVRYSDVSTALRSPEELRQLSKKQDYHGVRYVLAALIQQEAEEDSDAPSAARGDKGESDDDDGNRDESSAQEKKDEAAGEAAGKSETGEEDDAGKTDDEGTSGEDEQKRDDDEDSKKGKRGINVVYVTDIDLLHSAFLSLRAQGADTEGEVDWRLDNVTFVLNVLDILADDDRFVEIRKRQLRHSTLQLLEDRASEARDRANDSIKEAQDESEQAEKDAAKEKEDAIKKLQDRWDELKEQDKENPGSVNPNDLQAAEVRLHMRKDVAERREKTKKQKILRDLDRELRKNELRLELEIRRIQLTYKLWAVILPPIPPLAVALVVFVRRRLREREGVSRARLR